ncbi:YncE family protein [Chromohalobacter canadensis]|uniref:YncE family protein n=1 Tax=Chromohalobacter canadensis TaxID=141389 RepID=UPI00240F239F|nr:YncE family protein [Chromohalobacter canadensis]
MSYSQRQPSGVRRHASRLLTVSLLAAAISIAAPAFAHPEVTQRTQVEGSVYQIAVNPHNQRVYAAVTGNRIVDTDGSVRDVAPGIVVLDGQTLDVVKRIDTGDTSPFGLAFNAETQKLYATDTRHGTVAVFDVQSGERTALIDAPEGQSGHVREAVVDPATNTVYVSVVGGFSRGDEPAPKSAVWVIDGKTDTLEDVIENPVQVATGLAIDPAAKRLYVSDLANTQVAEIDLDSHKVTRTFAAAAEPASGKSDKGEDHGRQEAAAKTINLEIDTQRGLLYAVNREPGEIEVIDIAKGEVIDSIPTGDGALSARLNPQTHDLYVANRGDGTIAVIDGETRHVSAYLPGGSYPQTVAIAPESGLVYVSNKAKGRGRGAPDDVPTPYEPGGNTVIRIQP